MMRRLGSSPNPSSRVCMYISRMSPFPDRGLDPLRLVQLLGDADLESFQVLRLGDRHRLRQLDGRRVLGVAAGDDRVQAGAVADGLRDRADLVEARCEGADSVAGNGAV